MAKDFEHGQQLAHQPSQEICTMCYLLHPPCSMKPVYQEPFGWYIQGLAERSDLDIRLSISDDFGRVSPEMELVMFRLVQEA